MNLKYQVFVGERENPREYYVPKHEAFRMITSYSVRTWLGRNVMEEDGTIRLIGTKEKREIYDLAERWDEMK